MSSGATDQERIEDLIEQLDELGGNCARLMQENETLTKIVASDTQLVDAIAKIKALQAEVDVLRERNAGLMEEKNVAIAAARKLRRAEPKKVFA